ncbi:MAG: ribonuclease HI, partial [Dehalococcoidia bacterium]|nr:ribonuclease HI [Dehalococcoidia bacterium]
LEAVGNAAEVVLYSDSSLVINTMTKGWKRNKNQDLWEHLDRLARGKQITWKWVRGHNGTPGNELADSIASREADLPRLPADDATGRTRRTTL